MTESLAAEAFCLSLETCSSCISASFFISRVPQSPAITPYGLTAIVVISTVAQVSTKLVSENFNSLENQSIAKYHLIAGVNLISCRKNALQGFPKHLAL
jgi:hypothetical protein